MPADSQAPVPFQFSLKWFSGVWIPENVSQRFPHFPLHLRTKMADKVPNGSGDFESSFGHRVFYLPRSSSTV